MIAQHADFHRFTADPLPFDPDDIDPFYDADDEDVPAYRGAFEQPNYRSEIQ